jgi:hypothetical protein
LQRCRAAKRQDKTEMFHGSPPKLLSVSRSE